MLQQLYLAKSSCVKNKTKLQTINQKFDDIIILKLDRRRWFTCKPIVEVFSFWQLDNLKKTKLKETFKKIIF
jgi:hypothetical protein